MYFAGTGQIGPAKELPVLSQGRMGWGENRNAVVMGYLATPTVYLIFLYTASTNSVPSTLPAAIPLQESRTGSYCFRPKLVPCSPRRRCCAALRRAALMTSSCSLLVCVNLDNGDADVCRLLHFTSCVPQTRRPDSQRVCPNPGNRFSDRPAIRSEQTCPRCCALLFCSRRLERDKWRQRTLFASFLRLLSVQE